MRTISLEYTPRPWFKAFHARNQRWAILVKHRRAGKTVAAVRDLIEKAIYNPRPNPRYGYVAPLYNQAKQIAWQYLKDYTANIASKVSESGLFVELNLPSRPRITLFGADNPDSFRGLYFDGIVLDEYGNMRPSIFTEVLLPALIDRRGWAVFMGTPNGPNHFRDLWYEHEKDDDWFHSLATVVDTKVISEEELGMMRKLMSEEEFEQEMMCSFEASTRGAIFAREIKEAAEEGRVTSIEVDKGQPLHFVLDLGYADDTAIWCWQNRPDGYALVRTMSANTRPVKFYTDLIKAVCNDLSVPRGEVWLPHDARAKTLATKRSVVEQFIDEKIRPRIVPNLDLQDGIQAARLVFGSSWFDETGCRDGILALKSYRREWDEDNKTFREKPVHDWASHYGDAFRYFALVARKTHPKPISKEAPAESVEAHGAHYAFSLDQLHRDRRRLLLRRR